MIICHMGIKYRKQVRYSGVVFVLFGKARKRVTISLLNFIRRNSKWARYIDNNDDYDDAMIIIIITDTNTPQQTKIIFKFIYRRIFSVKNIS
jgi:hypothetical protein